jgi:hypothetical protein
MKVIERASSGDRIAKIRADLDPPVRRQDRDPRPFRNGLRATASPRSRAAWKTSISRPLAQSRRAAERGETRDVRQDRRIRVRYQVKNPVFWVAVILFFLLTFGSRRPRARCRSAPGGNIHKNSPYAILQVPPDARASSSCS